MRTSAPLTRRRHCQQLFRDVTHLAPSHTSRLQHHIPSSWRSSKAIPHVTTRARARTHDLSTQARSAHYPCRIPFISILPVASCRHGNGPCSPLTAMLATRITLRVPSFSIGSVICGSLQTSANGSTFLERLQRSTIRSM